VSDVVAGIALPDGDPNAVADAAASLRAVGGGFERASSVSQRAVEAVPSWQGGASMSFRDRCTNYQGAATGAHGACEQAAGALRRYAGELRDARTQVKKLQHEAADWLTRLGSAQTRAQDAGSRAQSASAHALQLTFAAPLDGGAGWLAADAKATEARAAAGRAQSEVTQAQGELDRLRAQAEKIRRHVEEEARTAAHAVDAAAGELPTIDGASSSAEAETVLRSEEDKYSMSVTVFFVKLGGSTTAIEEEHADGRWTVTLVDGLEGGVQANLIPKFKEGDTAPGGKTGGLGGGAELQAALVAQYENGKTYSFGNKGQADTFLRWKDKEPPSVPLFTQAPPMPAAWKWAQAQKPVATYTQGGGKASIDATVTAGSTGGGGSLDGAVALGTRHGADGSQTRYVKSSADVSGNIKVPGARVEGSLNGESVTAITRSHGRLANFSMTSTAAGNAAGGLAPEAEHAGYQNTSGPGVRVERQVQLDMSDPRNRTAVENYLQTQGSDPAAAHALRDRIDASARVDLRFYDTSASTHGVSVNVDAFGAEASHERSHSALQAAFERAPGSHRAVRVAP